MRAVILVAALALGACQAASPIAVDSGCEKLQRKDFTDKGLRLQSDANKRADIGNETWWLRDCAAASSGLKGGPR